MTATAKACPADCAELAMRQMSRALLYHFNAVCVLLLVGARDEIRTRDICLGKATLYHSYDPLLVRQVLSQLSYASEVPIKYIKKEKECKAFFRKILTDNRESDH